MDLSTLRNFCGIASLFLPQKPLRFGRPLSLGVRLKSSMSIFQGNSWSITLLPEWTGEHEEECSTVYHPRGVGALKISSYSKDSVVTESDLREFAQERIEAGAKLHESITGDFKGFTLAFAAEDEFWQYWYVANSNKFLLITYNCNEANLGPEREQAKSMVASLKAAT